MTSTCLSFLGHWQDAADFCPSSRMQPAASSGSTRHSQCLAQHGQAAIYQALTAHLEVVVAGKAVQIPGEVVQHASLGAVSALLVCMQHRILHRLLLAGGGGSCSLGSLPALKVHRFQGPKGLVHAAPLPQ